MENRIVLHFCSVVSLSSNLGSNLPSAFLTLRHFLNLMPATLPSFYLPAIFFFTIPAIRAGMYLPIPTNFCSAGIILE